MFNATYNLGAIDGVNGFVMSGSDAAYRNSRSVAVVDLNGDGFGDLVTGSSTANALAGSGSGIVSVLFGGSSPQTPIVFNVNLNGVNGFNINGASAGDETGTSVSSAGDFNGDGIEDLLIGAPEADSLAGAAYVVYGSKIFPSAIELGNLGYVQGFTLATSNPGDRFGYAVSKAGDINGDGIDDVIIGARYADPGGRSAAGISYVMFGSKTPYVSTFDVTSMTSSQGFAINGVTAADRSGTAVGPAGDINGDGIDDVIIGADYADPGGKSRAGTAYVVFGRNTTFPANFELSTLNGAEGFLINGAIAEDRAGAFVRSAGDVNGDAVDDLLLGAPGFTTSPGTGYLLFGNKNGFPTPIDLSSINGTTGVIFNGITNLDRTGSSMTTCDFNQDGFEDIIIGAPYADPLGMNSAGKTYVVFGKSEGFDPVTSLSSLDGINGFTLFGGEVFDTSGFNVVCEDINGDGMKDLTMGGPQRLYKAAAQVGGSSVLYGISPPSPAATSTSTSSSTATSSGSSSTTTLQVSGHVSSLIPSLFRSVFGD